MITIKLPPHLQELARVGAEIRIEVAGAVTTHSILTALEATYPVLRGTLRDQISGKRRPLIRFYACREDWSLQPPDTPLPEAVASGAEPFLIIGAIAGG